MKIHFRLFVVFLFTAGLFPSAYALVLAGGNGLGNTTAPTNDPGWCHIGWSNVGSVRSPSNTSRAGAVYLGDDWFITNYHVWYYDSPTGVVVGTTCYTVDTNSLHRLTNSITVTTNITITTNSTVITTNTTVSTNMQPLADIAMFRVKQKPNLPPLNITTMSPGGLWWPVVFGGNKTVIMIGSGHPRTNLPSYWDADWTNTTPSNAVYSGYEFWPDRSRCIPRWGTNQIDILPGFIANFIMTMQSPFGSIVAFKTTFNTNAGSDECQVGPLDSGGGVFYRNNGYWELAGLMNTFKQPDGTEPKNVWGIADGGISCIADLSYYRNQVMDIIKTNGWPDLVIVDPSSFTTNAIPGAQFPILITTRNRGTAAATNFITALYVLLEGSHPTTSVTQAAFTTLGAGESVTNTYTFTAPAAPGIYYLIAKADDGTNDDGNVHESYENNNQSGTRARLLEVGPDLVIVDPSPVTNSASPTAPFSIPITTWNRGTATASNFITSIYLVNSAVTTKVAQAAFTTLGAGESATNIYSFTVPTNAGVYNLIAKADDSNQVSESNEANNWSGLRVRLLNVGPDITVSSSTNSFRIAANLSGKINLVTRNTGSDASGFETVLFLSATNTVASMTNAVVTNQFSGLPAGQSVTTNFNFRAPGKSGTYYLCALADRSGSVTEFNETNNWSGMVTLEVVPMALPWLNLLLE